MKIEYIIYAYGDWKNPLTTFSVEGIDEDECNEKAREELEDFVNSIEMDIK